MGVVRAHAAFASSAVPKPTRDMWHTHVVGWKHGGLAARRLTSLRLFSDAKTRQIILFLVSLRSLRGRSPGPGVYASKASPASAAGEGRGQCFRTLGAITRSTPVLQPC